MANEIRTVSHAHDGMALCRVQDTKEAKVNLGYGLLVGLDADDKVVLADAKLGIPAVGVVNEISEREFGSAISMARVAELRAGDTLELTPFCVIRNVEEVKTAKIGQKVYLGENGLMTLTENAESGEVNQCVGSYAGGLDHVVRVMLFNNGEVNA